MNNLRPHQARALAAFNAGKRNQFLTWHRRAGKDHYAMYLINQERKNRPALYWHMLPKSVQARRAIWDGIDPNTGERYLYKIFPECDVFKERIADMALEFNDGSMYQLIGSDNYDRLVGSNPAGIVFSEWALCDPSARSYLRPILVENKGFEIYITTFRFRNHAWKLFNRVKGLKGWYVENLDITKTRREDGRPIISEQDLDAERESGVTERVIRQEYYNDPTAAGGTVFDVLADSLSEELIDSRNPWTRLDAVWYTGNEGTVCLIVMPGMPAVIYDCMFWSHQSMLDAVNEVQSLPWAIRHFCLSPLEIYWPVFDKLSLQPMELATDESQPHHVAVTFAKAKSQKKGMSRSSVLRQLPDMLRGESGEEEDAMPCEAIMDIFMAYSRYKADDAEQWGPARKYPHGRHHHGR